MPEIKLLSGRSVLISYGNEIDPRVGQQIYHVARFLGQESENWITEIVPAYCSLSVFFELRQVMQLCGDSHPLEWVKRQLVEIIRDAGNWNSVLGVPGQLHDIPVCYDGEDLQEISHFKNLDVKTIIEIHTSRVYSVFMIGFLPGFGYLGTVDERIAVPRHSKPRTKVSAGSVGIAGLQTGIYPMDSPGGWQIIGRTPLAMFNPDALNPSLLKHGDSVRFYPISPDQFKEIRGH